MNLNKHLQKILCSHVITKLDFSLENVGMADHYYIHVITVLKRTEQVTKRIIPH